MPSVRLVLHKAPQARSSLRRTGDAGCPSCGPYRPPVSVSPSERPSPLTTSLLSSKCARGHLLRSSSRRGVGAWHVCDDRCECTTRDSGVQRSAARRTEGGVAVLWGRGQGSCAHAQCFRERGHRPLQVPLDQKRNISCCDIAIAHQGPSCTHAGDDRCGRTRPSASCSARALWRVRLENSACDRGIRSLRRGRYLLQARNRS